MSGTVRGRFQRFVAVIAAAIGVGCAPDGPTPGAPITLVVAAGHSPAFAWVQLFREEFIPSLDARLASTRYRVEWREAYGGSVAKLGGVLEALEVGIVEVGLIATVFEASKLPLQNLTYVTPFGPEDPEVVTQVMGALRERVPALDEAWARHNAVRIGAFAVETYDLYCTTPVRRLSDLRGKKILAPGPAANWIRGTGAVAVSGDLSTYYSDLRTGVADGALTLATGVWGARLYEVAPFRTPVGLGAQYVGGVAVNRETWERFPPVVQDAFRAAGQDYTLRQSRNQRELALRRIREMEALGLERVVLAAGEREAWARALPNVAGEWAELLEARGLPARRLLDAYRDVLRTRGIETLGAWSIDG